MFNLVKYAPSAFNLQHAHYVVVKDPDLEGESIRSGGKTIQSPDRVGGDPGAGQTRRPQGRCGDERRAA